MISLLDLSPKKAKKTAVFGSISIILILLIIDVVAVFHPSRIQSHIEVILETITGAKAEIQSVQSYSLREISAKKITLEEKDLGEMHIDKLSLRPGWRAILPGAIPTRHLKIDNLNIYNKNNERVIWPKILSGIPEWPFQSVAIQSVTIHSPNRTSQITLSDLLLEANQGSGHISGEGVGIGTLKFTRHENRTVVRVQLHGVKIAQLPKQLLPPWIKTIANQTELTGSAEIEGDLIITNAGFSWGQGKVSVNGWQIRSPEFTENISSINGIATGNEASGLVNIENAILLNSQFRANGTWENGTLQLGWNSDQLHPQNLPVGILPTALKKALGNLKFEGMGSASGTIRYKQDAVSPFQLDGEFGFKTFNFNGNIDGSAEKAGIALRVNQNKNGEKIGGLTCRFEKLQLESFSFHQCQALLTAQWESSPANTLDIQLNAGKLDIGHVPWAIAIAKSQSKIPEFNTTQLVGKLTSNGLDIEESILAELNKKREGYAWAVAGQLNTDNTLNLRVLTGKIRFENENLRWARLKAWKLFGSSDKPTITEVELPEEPEREDAAWNFLDGTQ